MTDETRKEDYGHSMKGLECELEETRRPRATEGFLEREVVLVGLVFGKLLRYLWDGLKCGEIKELGWKLW